MTFFTLGKVLLALLWLLTLIAVLFPSMSIGGGFVLKAALVTLVIHLIELMFVDWRLRGLPKPWVQRLQVLLFGYFYWGRLDRKMPESE